MDTIYVVAWIGAIAFIAYYSYRIFKATWNCFDHSKIATNAVLSPDAIITNVQSEKVQYVKNGMKFKTTVSFSDGFTFVTHKTNREDGFLTYQIAINGEEILENAKKAHERALKKQQKAKERQGN